MNPFWKQFTDVLKTVSLRYFVFAGIVWLIWYVLLKKKIAFKKFNFAFLIITITEEKLFTLLLPCSFLH